MGEKFGRDYRVAVIVQSSFNCNFIGCLYWVLFACFMPYKCIVIAVYSTGQITGINLVMIECEYQNKPQRSQIRPSGLPTHKTQFSVRFFLFFAIQIVRIEAITHFFRTNAIVFFPKPKSLPFTLDQIDSTRRHSNEQHPRLPEAAQGLPNLVQSRRWGFTMMVDTK